PACASTMGDARPRGGTAPAARATPARRNPGRAKLLLNELGKARRGVELPLAPIHGDYNLGNPVQPSAGSRLHLELDFVRIRERLYDVAGSLYFASESGASVDLRELRDAYDSSAPERVTPDERQLLPAQITPIPLHWVEAAGFMDERIGGP